MPSVYPAALDTFAINKANATVTANDHPAHHNDLADAINKIEATLGIDPAGSEADVVTRLDAIDTAISGISGGDIVFADVGSAGVSIDDLADQTIWTEDVAVAVGDTLIVETWGRGNNGTGGARNWVLTLDFDSIFDMEWLFTAGAVDQGWRMEAKLAVPATNFAAYLLESKFNQVGSGSLAALSNYYFGYETSTSDLTGTVTVALKGRSEFAGGTQVLFPYSTTIRKIPST
jgi:hypothetical protein